MLLLTFCTILFVLFFPAILIKGQIIGGQEADSVTFSYQVALVKEDAIIHCGGGIIGSNFVLTTAHCVLDTDGTFLRELLTAVIGTASLYDECELAIRIPVVKMYVTREYIRPKNIWGVSYTSKGDIAVLKLKTSIYMSQNTKFTILKIPTNYYEKYINEVAIIAGFGFNEVSVEKNTKTNEFIQVGKSDGKMRHAEVKVLSNDKCDEIMSVSIYPSHVCARIENFDDMPEGVCNGDSGGPLVLEDKTVIGVLSFGAIDCNEEEGTGVYTRTSHYIDFINSAMKDNKIINMRRAVWHFTDDGKRTLSEY